MTGRGSIGRLLGCVGLWVSGVLVVNGVSGV